MDSLALQPAALVEAVLLGLRQADRRDGLDDAALRRRTSERKLEQAEKQGSDSLAGSGAGALVDQIESLEQEMREHTYEFRLRALPKPAWRKLCGEHPPRRGEDSEIVPTDLIGVNAETFYDAIIRACLVDPELNDEQWEQLVGSLTDRQYDELADAAWGLNRREVDIPFSHAASRMKRDSAAE